MTTSPNLRTPWGTETRSRIVSDTDSDMESDMTCTTTDSATTMDLDMDMVFLQQKIRLYLARMFANIIIRYPARRRYAATLQTLRRAQFCAAELLP